MAYKDSFEELVKKFISRGGKIDRFYLREPNRAKHALVHLNGWFSGSNVREAILKAFGK